MDLVIVKFDLIGENETLVKDNGKTWWLMTSKRGWKTCKADKIRASKRLSSNRGYQMVKNEQHNISLIYKMNVSCAWLTVLWVVESMLLDSLPIAGCSITWPDPSVYLRVYQTSRVTQAIVRPKKSPVTL